MKLVARNVSQLCPAIPLSRSEYYRLRRLPGAPLPMSDGRHSITAWRRFAKRKRNAKGPSDKESLELRCLQLKAERLQHELDESKETTYNKVRDGLLMEFEGVMYMLRSEMRRMRGELAPRLSGLDAREAYNLMRDRERTLFTSVVERLRKRTGGDITEPQTRPTENIVQLQFNGNGDVRRASARKAAAL